MAGILKPINSTENLLNKVLKDKEEVRHSNGIAISTLGEECERKLWYSLRWVQSPSKFDGQKLRLFRRGKVVEREILEDLKEAGLDIYEVNEDGTQYRVEAHTGHISGYIDGVGKGFPEAPTQYFLLEIKSHNEKNFEKLKKDGVKKSHYKHYVQCIMGMGLAKPRLNRALYIAYNKNTSEIYIEQIKFDEKEFNKQKEKAEKIILSEKPLKKISESENSYNCQHCDYNIRCHQARLLAVIPEISCRTCAHVTPDLIKGWVCDKYNLVLTNEQQKTACKEHLFNPHIMPYAVVSATTEEVVYKNIEGKTIVNKNGLLEVRE